MLQLPTKHPHLQALVVPTDLRPRRWRQAHRSSQQDIQAPLHSDSVHSTNPGSCDVHITVAEPIEPLPAHPKNSSFNPLGVVIAAAIAATWLSKLRSNRASAQDCIMQTEELDPDIIAAARARRSRERANQRLDLDDVELPENHPWATRKPVTEEQEAAIQARLQVRPRRAAPGSAGRPEPRSGRISRE